MSNDSVSIFYRSVIDEVIESVRGAFEESGLEESVLEVLQRTWESKIARSHVTNFGSEYGEDDDARNGVERLSLNQHFSQSPAATLASIASSSTSARQPHNLPHLTAEALANSQVHVSGQQLRSSAPDMSRTRQNISQNDGPADEITITQNDAQLVTSTTNQRKSKDFDHSSAASSGRSISIESLPDKVQKLIRHARERHVGSNSVKASIVQLDGTVADEDELNSDLDDPDDDGVEEVEDVVLCLYEKVTHTKTKWKCVLKDGIMLVNERDYLFHRVNGELEF